MPHKLEYWNECLVQDDLPRQNANRYVVFDIDQGGVNNIRLVFEYVATIAAVTGRTLVLPPSKPWYLINWGPLPEEHQGGSTHISELFDIPALKSAIPVLDTNEFIQQAQSHLDIPTEFSNKNNWIKQSATCGDNWKQWLLDNSVIPGWNPYDTVICSPNIDSAETGPHFNEQYLDGRQPVEFTPWMQAAPILYFPSDSNFRSLGPVATMFASNNESLPMLARRFIKHHIRFRREIFKTTIDLLNTLELQEFDAMQIRRGDFQYSKTRVSASKVCANTKNLFDKQLPIYIATDESREKVFQELEQGLNAERIFRWKDIEPLLKEPIPYSWTGPIEQIICSAARRFAGNDLSTFTAYINRLRGYSCAEDTNLYFHSEANDGPKQTLITDFKGRTYLRENPLFWLSC